MKQENRKMYAFWILLTEALGLLSGFVSRTGMVRYEALAQKPPLTPPGWVFGIVWTVLYGLMGFSAGRVFASPESRDRSRSLNLFIAQLVVNFFWSPIYFNTGAYGFALIWLVLLWVLVVLMIRQFDRVNRTAALLQIPYLLWLSFAAYLNWSVWLQN